MLLKVLKHLELARNFVARVRESLHYTLAMTTIKMTKTKTWWQRIKDGEGINECDTDDWIMAIIAALGVIMIAAPGLSGLR